MLPAKVVTNAPYSGVGVTTSNRTLADGNTITESRCVKFYRDSTGRTRQEETPNSATCAATPAAIVITDPAAGVRYFVNTKAGTYRQMTFHAPPEATPATGHHPRNSTDQVETSLGTQPITGTSLNAEGTQTVRTIPAGQFGNAQPITINTIRWYSPDLQVVVQTSHTDPRNGTVTYQLSDISTAEPAASLFQLPSGLTLEKGPGPRGRRAP